MSEDNLARTFSEKAAPPAVLDTHAYFQTLEKLMTEGQGYGKTEPVAAYFLRNLRIVNEGDNEEEIAVQPLYVVMDLAEMPNEYARSLVMQDIFASYARRIVGEHHLNHPDFHGPGVWTAKQSAFEGDYKLKDGTDDIYEPDPHAYRLCTDVDETVTIPVQWGTYTIGAGGTIAVRAQDVPALAEALQSVRDGRSSIEDALYVKKKDGSMVAKFDVYGMEPGFRRDNYGPVFLPEDVQKTLIRFADDAEEDKHASRKTARRKDRRSP